MKTISIPKNWGNPLVIEINTGERVTLEAGKTLEVEDNVAEIIENAIANLPKESNTLPIDPTVKAYIDNKEYIDCLTLTQETALKIDGTGIRHNVGYTDSMKMLLFQLYATVKSNGEPWKIKELDTYECNDFTFFGRFIPEDGSEGEAGEITKKWLEDEMNLPIYSREYNSYFNWCGIKWLGGECLFGYSVAWDVAPLLQNYETEEEKQALIQEINDVANSLNEELNATVPEYISIFRTVKNLPVIEREVK